MPARHTILCINVGSSSCKFAIYSVSGAAESIVAEGAAERIDTSGGKIRIRDASGRSLAESDRELARPQIAVDALLGDFERLKLPRLDAVGHRIVHGGAHHVAPELVTPALIADLKHGASMAAVANGRPLDTTMGFTPAGGFMMGTRPGDLDPGVILFLLQQQGYGAERLGELVNQKSGLLGVSGLSSDVKTLLDVRATNADAAMAIEMFCYQIRKSIGALAAALGGLDMLVFTGGIDEHAAAVRAEVCQGLAHLGLAIDPRRNESNQGTISAPDSRCRVRVIPTNENLMVASHTSRLVFQTV